jgi:hypothetical protein
MLGALPMRPAKLLAEREHPSNQDDDFWCCTFAMSPCAIAFCAD